MDEAKRVLIVDDDKNISELLKLYFEKDGFKVSECYTGDAVIPMVRAIDPDVIILDLMLPGMSGFDIMRELRRESDVPVLMLTARSDTLDKIIGLELGADDYILKPFDPKELIARVKAVLRRSRNMGHFQPEADSKKKDIVVYPDLIIDRIRYAVRIGEREIDMPPKELELLFFLASYPNRVFTRDQILEHIWGMDYYGEQRTVDVHIKRIREKLDIIDHPLWQIKTVWSVGYKFEVKDPADL
ncbi:MAG: response regulator transcription factor [Clostridiaceae bacterium]|jgi:DNA-binding response OmpR family regulator|nr:response regulator transcription factor [Clostridiaceae bacterium]